MHGLAHLEEVLVFLIAAVCIVPLFRWFKSSAVLGYLAAGVLVGPHALGLIQDPEAVLRLADLGVIFLLFTIGLELSIERLKLLRHYVFGLGAAQVVVTAVAIGGVLFAFGQSVEAALIIGSGLALSSTAFVIQMLVERGEMITRYGRVSFSILLFQDLAIVPLLALLPLLGQPESSLAAAIGIAAVKAVAVVTAAVLIGRRVLRPLYRVIAAARLQELFVAVTLLVVLGTGWLMGQAGISMALGAFLAGLLLSETEYRHQVEADIRPFKGLLLGLFFMAVGMAIDLPLVAREWLVLLLAVIALLALKSVLIGALCLLFRLPATVALRVGPLLSQGGEFGFVLVGGAMLRGLVDLDLGQMVLAVIALSMAATPAMDWFGAVLSRRAAPQPSHDVAALKEEVEGVSEHIIIAGFGRVGQTVARVVSACGLPYVALDLDHARVARGRKAGLPLYFGDASRVDVLEAAGIERAKAAVITIDRASEASQAVSALHQRMPGLPVFVRSHDMSHAHQLEAEGAAAVVPETVEASLQLGGILLSAVGIGTDDVTRVTNEFRDNNYARLEDLVEAAADGAAAGETPKGGKKK
ncbi:MAG: glutathione-regulated potassium-efflux system protein KefB [Kiloniellaceae bacterium]